MLVNHKYIEHKISMSRAALECLMCTRPQGRSLHILGMCSCSRFYSGQCFAGSLFQAAFSVNSRSGPISESKEHSDRHEMSTVSDSDTPGSDPQAADSAPEAPHPSIAGTAAQPQPGIEVQSVQSTSKDSVEAATGTLTTFSETASIHNFPSAASRIRSQEDVPADPAPQGMPDMLPQSSLAASAADPGLGADTLQTLARMPTPEMSTAAAMSALDMLLEEKDANEEELRKQSHVNPCETQPAMGLDTMASLARMATPDMSTAMLMEALDTRNMENRHGPESAAQALSAQGEHTQAQNHGQAKRPGRPSDEGTLGRPAPLDAIGVTGTSSWFAAISGMLRLWDYR